MTTVSALFLLGAAAAAASMPMTSIAAPQSAADSLPTQRSYWNNRPPAYPLQSIEADEAGTVRVAVRISEQGLPQQLTLVGSSGFPRLDHAALAAVKAWHFIPAQRKGAAVPSTLIIPIEFSLKPGKP